MICGLKLTHDGGLAVIEEGKLVFSTEVEKIGNNRRHSPLHDLGIVTDQLRENGVEFDDLEQLSIDGWVWPTHDRLCFSDKSGVQFELAVAPYSDTMRTPSKPLSCTSGEIRLNNRTVPFVSYPHTVDHTMSGYCTSPFAKRGEPALVLTWDGGSAACLYSVDPSTRSVVNLGQVLCAPGVVYPVFASTLEPFRELDWVRVANHSMENQGLEAAWERLLSISGKAMAYAGLGEPDERVVAALASVSHPPVSASRRGGLRPTKVARLRRSGLGLPNPFIWAARCRRVLEPMQVPEPVQMASLQEFLYRELCRGIQRVLGPSASPRPLCFVGGCALNIKWNSRLRASGMFTDVWVPPFPNDAGSAIGAGCSLMFDTTNRTQLDWSVFTGPRLKATVRPPSGWSSRPMSIPGLATLLHQTGKPVVVLTGRAELGPRALGHRSIIAPAVDRRMHEELNRIKRRESFRPVAPICTEKRSPEIFDPGVPDPYMLFDHQVRPAWRKRISAIVHVDNTARLQTVRHQENPVIAELLDAYEARSGIPVLCNTSANFSGSGFFPDAESAMRWGRTEYVWSEGTLFSRNGAAVASGDRDTRPRSHADG